jgi:hypothetical protein
MVTPENGEGMCSESHATVGPYFIFSTTKPKNSADCPEANRVSVRDLEIISFRRPLHVRCAQPGNRPAQELGGTMLADAFERASVIIQ